MTIWTPSLSTQGPRYRAIADAIGEAIRAGQLAPGERLPPQRRLADALRVTVGTVTRAYAEAERQGWLVARVGSGTYVRGEETYPRAFLAASSAGDEDVVDLSLSLPPPHPLRATALGEVLEAIAADHATLSRVVEYQAEWGESGHRERLSAWLQRLGMFVAAEQLIVTQGGQHGISLVLQSLTRPGERIAASALTYPGMISAAQQAHLKLLRIPLDDDGLDVEALARLCQQQPPKLVYVTPDQNNPTAAYMSEARRQRLADLSREHDFWILEDGVQYLPAAERGTPLYRLAPERTLFVFSTSKVLAGGLRVGTLKVPASLMPRVGAAVRAQSWMVPPLMVEAVCRWVESDAAERLLAWQTEEIGARQRLAQEYLAGFDIRGRPHGANVWLVLPEGLRSSVLLEALTRDGVCVTSAEPFCVESEPAPQAIRLCVSAASSREALRRALERLVSALERPPPVSHRTL